MICYACNVEMGSDLHRTPVKFDGIGTYGMGILCEKCWSERTPGERLPFYIRHYRAIGRWPFSLKELQSTVMNEAAETKTKPRVSIEIRSKNQ